MILSPVAHQAENIMWHFTKGHPFSQDTLSIKSTGISTFSDLTFQGWLISTSRHHGWPCFFIWTSYLWVRVAYTHLMSNRGRTDGINGQKATKAGFKLYSKTLDKCLFLCNLQQLCKVGIKRTIKGRKVEVGSRPLRRGTEIWTLVPKCMPYLQNGRSWQTWRQILMAQRLKHKIKSYKQAKKPCSGFSQVECPWGTEPQDCH